jgi:hypothetical protein
MKRDSVLELKQEILDSLRPGKARRGGTEAQSLVNPRIESRIAVGFSKKSDRQYQLEIRVQRRNGAAYEQALGFKEKARNEANIEEIPVIEIPSKGILMGLGIRARLGKIIRPLHIGLSIGHTDGGAGTLGAFVSDRDGAEYILSNNHVLAPSKEADLRDPIFQPGRPDQSPLLARLKIAELSDFNVINNNDRNEFDAAIAALIEGIEHESNRIPTGAGIPGEGRLIRQVKSKDEALNLLSKDKPVCKIGRTTGFTAGTIGAVALDNVTVKTSLGNVVFDDLIQVNWLSGRKPFSKPGDSGSLVFTRDGLRAVGLHFAGGIRMVRRSRVGVSYSCNLATVLESFNVSLLD